MGGNDEADPYSYYRRKLVISGPCRREPGLLLGPNFAVHGGMGHATVDYSFSNSIAGFDHAGIDI
jgi:hypothetical protein